MSDMIVTRAECIEHFRAMNAVQGASPGSKWFAFKNKEPAIDTDLRAYPELPDTHATLDAETLEDRKAEVNEASADGWWFQLAMEVSLMDGTEFYRKLIRFAQYACTCARNGDLETAFKTLKLIHEMDKQFFAVKNKGPQDECGQTLLLIVSWTLFGGKYAQDLLGANMKEMRENEARVCGRTPEGGLYVRLFFPDTIEC